MSLHLKSLPRITSIHPACLALLQSCTSMAQLLQIHAQMLRNHLFQDPFAAGKLLESLVASPQGSLHYARKLFGQIPHPNAVAYNTIIRGYANSPAPTPALRLFQEMLFSGVKPNSYTYPFLLKVCAHLSALEEGEQLHAFLLKAGADSDVFSVNGLIHMYATCQRIELGRRLFDLSDVKDVVSWNVMLSGYVNCGLVDCARHCFDEMPERGIVSWNAMITGYAKCGHIDAARELFDRMPERNAESWNTMIAAYAKCGRLDMSQKLFDEMHVRNVVSWSAMITAYAQGDHPNEALALFNVMKETSMKPNWATIVSVLSACSHLGALEQGRGVHAYIERNKMKVDSIIGTALIDMYAKCGFIDGAFEIFESLVTKDVFSWTAMIVGLAVNGHGSKALELFSQMEGDGVKPNEVTFVGILCACSRGGWVQLARQYFDSMSMIYGIEPHIEHYGCMVDALGRAGLLEEAVSLVESMPGKANCVLWGTLLGACWIHGNADIGEYVAERLVELKPQDGGIYVLLSNIYAMRGRWDDAREARMLIKLKGLQKEPGCSSIKVHGHVHEFHVGDKSHPDTVEIYQKLGEIASRLKIWGYEPNKTPALFDIEQEEKEHAVSYHSKKLAIASGLISIGADLPDLPIRVVKNLRVCQ